MVNQTAVKATLCAAALLLSVNFGITAKAATISDTAIAGITVAYDDYLEATPSKEIGEAEKLLDSFVKQSKESTTEDEVTKVESPYANLGISIANDYVNIRKEANTDSEIVGKLYRGCATDILDTKDDWVKIESGNVKGYINKEYLAIGEEAEALVDEFATKYAVIDTETLFVREKPNKEAAITTMVPLGEKYYIVKEYKKWAKIKLDDDTGFVSKDYIKIEVEFDYAISIEEEQAKIAAEKAAKQAETERLEALAREQEEKRLAQEAAKTSSRSSSSKSSSSSSSQTTTSSSTGSATGQAIANYALNFVGNPYVWGGTSLTNGADCSGFVQSIYAHFGYSIARTSSSQASSAGVRVDVSNLQPGDLIFYANSSGNVSHVAMYIGGGRVVHASNAREGIKTSAYNYRSIYCARRIVN